MAIFRVDYTVTDTQGRALSGAQVWACNQPATIANPPSPLATVYADEGGDPGTNPQITDGYGHCAFYLSNTQLYTVVYYHPLIGLLSYPDQNISSVSQTVTPVQAIPSGAINGTNVTFTLPSAPAYPSFLMLNLNGVTLTQGLAYTLSGVTITMATAPQIGDTLNAFYL